MFEMPVTDTVHPPPSSLPTHSVFSNVPSSSAGRVQCSISELCRAYFCVFLFLKPTSTLAHIVAVWCNEATRELFSQGDFMEGLIYGTAIHTILLVPPNPPLCPSHWLSSSLSPFCPFLILSLQLCPSPFIPSWKIEEEKSNLPVSQQAEMSRLRQGREIELGPRHWQSSETQQGCEQLNIERLFGAVMMSQAGEERKGEANKWGKRRTAAVTCAGWYLFMAWLCHCSK